jgi:hypothetical protein
METLNSVWVLSHLWKENGLFNSKIKILDTLLGNPDGLVPFIWLYTDAKGYTTKKPTRKSSIRDILSAFVAENEERKEDIYGNLIHEENYLPLSKKKMQIKISNQFLSPTEALQLFPKTPGSSSTRYIIQITNNTHKFYKQYQIKENIEKVKLSSHRHCNFMLETSKEVVYAIEKNISDHKDKIKVQEISIMFIEDFNRNLWVMGTLDCKVIHINSYEKLSIGLSTFSFKSSSHSNLFRNKSSLSKVQCGGDFCKFVVKSSDLKNKTEIDYDNLVKFIQLQKVNLAYRERQDKDLEKIKLALRADHLLSRKLNSARGALSKQVTFKDILLGRRIKELAAFDISSIGPAQLLEIDIQEIIDSVHLIKHQIEQEDAKPLGLKSPYHYYDVIKVCERCYEVYNLLAVVKPPKTVAKDTPVNIIDMNSLDYLLDDIQTLKFEMKYGETMTPSSFLHKVTSETHEKSFTKKELSKETPTQMFIRRATIDIKKIEGKNYEKLTEQIFPDAKFIYKEKKTSKACHQGFITKLQLKSI